MSNNTLLKYGDPDLEQKILDHINAEMQRAAAPIIQEFNQRMEDEMRRVMFRSLVAMIRTDIDMRRNGTDLQITLRQALRSGHE